MPTSEKKIVIGNTTATSNAVNTGDTINYQTTITAQSGAQNYVVHDTMSAGLTFDSTSLKVSRKNGNADATDVDAANFTLTTPASNNETFTLSFKQSFLDTLVPGEKLIITYNAKLTNAAAVTLPTDSAATPNTNTSFVTYGTATGTSGTGTAKAGQTTENVTNTYTYALPIYKTTNAGGTEKGLAGAKFTLSTNSNGSNPITFDANNFVDPDGKVTEFTTPETPELGKFTLKGLAPGTYYLTETEAPAGYAKLAASIKIVINADGSFVESITAGEENTDTDEVKVVNQTHAELPGTGGIGTTIFYVVGAVLIIGAIVLLVTRKRMNHSED